jgi:hypothetical protein
MSMVFVVVVKALLDNIAKKGGSGVGAMMGLGFITRACKEGI